MVVSAVSEKNKDPFGDRVDPEAGARKSVVSEALRRHPRPSRRALRGRKLEPERAVLVQARGEVGPGGRRPVVDNDSCLRVGASATGVGATRGRVERLV